MINSSLIAKAIFFAASAHGSQLTPTGLPYLSHLMTVAFHTMAGTQDSYSSTEHVNAIIVAILHDTIEDTEATYAEICAAFGIDIAEGVLALSKDKSLATKHLQMEDSLNRILLQPRWVWCVKLSDRITNLTAIPEQWEDSKILKYTNEAILIHEALYLASPYLADLLLHKIKSTLLLNDLQSDSTYFAKLLLKPAKSS
jgi:(p)ppGpp synthase/HD superfamily hydrolase